MFMLSRLIHSFSYTRSDLKASQQKYISKAYPIFQFHNAYKMPLKREIL